MMDYCLCDQTVTIYRKVENRIHRQVVNGVYYTYREVHQEDESGVRRQRLCQLILPADGVEIQIGDRVYDGIGPQISLAGWSMFLPVTVAGLSEINYVTPCYWDGELCHIEAGRK